MQIQNPSTQTITVTLTPAEISEAEAYLDLFGQNITALDEIRQALQVQPMTVDIFKAIILARVNETIYRKLTEVLK